MKKSLMLICTLCVVLSLPLTVRTQAFSSGSTGADGALDLATMTCPGNTCEIQLPESGIFNYTTVNVPSGRSLRFRRNSHNTPIILLAQGNITIAGIIDLNAVGRDPGPGGFYGGPPNLNGGTGPNLPGFGPGAGPQTDGNPSGKWVGPLSLFPTLGGSGGSGGSQCTFVGQSPYGGGGGGAITIASSQAVILTGTIVAVGGAVQCPFGGAGGGSGGATRLVGSSIDASGSSCSLAASGSRASNYPGYDGVIRLEAPPGQLIFTGTAQPAAVLSTINPSITPAAMPSLAIASVGARAVPAYAGSRFDSVDLLLPTQLTDPIAVVVQGHNIPVGTQVNVGFLSGSVQGTSNPGTLAGTFENSTATATISALNRTGVTYLLATATFDPPATAQKFNAKGPDHVAKMRIESGIGAKPTFVFLRSNGSVIDQAKLPKPFLLQLGR